MLTVVRHLIPSINFGIKFYKQQKDRNGGRKQDGDLENTEDHELFTVNDTDTVLASSAIFIVVSKQRSNILKVALIRWPR